jgi:alpha-ribazole phosphatase
MYPVPKSIYVVRHAKVVSAGICYGQSDVEVELSSWEACGRVSAKHPDLAARVEVIWTSPFQRARGLAECLGESIHSDVRLDERLSELNFGVWEGRSWAEIYREDRLRFADWAADSMHLAPPGGENGQSLVDRVGSWLHGVGTERILAVTHAGPIRVLRAISVAGFDRTRLSLDFGREVPHLTVEEITFET